MNNASLFSTSLTGTKNLINQYHDTIEKALNFISDHPFFKKKEVF